MAVEYSPQTIGRLEQIFQEAELLRPMRVRRHEPGTELVYEVTGVAPRISARVRLVVEKFVGGGFAGGVYRAKVLEIAPSGDPIAGLTVGGTYAVKILVPPGGASRRFRNLIYEIGFQGPFSLQVNPAAARAGALWMKFIRRGAKIRFGTERAVVDVLGTFVDHDIGSCGEISEWVEGRNWQFEVDDRLDARRRWGRGKAADPSQLGSPEYRAKKTFMRDMLELLHEMGAPELARQYEWSTWKSQPNVLKRLDTEGDPEKGLTAVDFRAGLALLPFLPMSPGDFKLIAKGIARGSLVQFDRGNLKKLQRFVDAHQEEFSDLRDALEELKTQDRAYRESLPDVTHHHLRLVYSRGLWSSILDGAVTSWRIRNITDEAATSRLRRSRTLTLLFLGVGLMPLLGVCAAAALLVVSLVLWKWTPWVIPLALILGVGVPVTGRFVRRVWGRGDYRRHYWRMLTSLGYFHRSARARIAEKLMDWVRSGRVSDERAGKLVQHPWRFFAHLPLSVLFAKIHRFLTDRRFASGALKYIFARPVWLFFNAEAREQWLRDMIAEGRRKGMVNEQDAERINSRVKEPFIQKYLKSLAVHLCTLPVTQIVSAIVALVYVLKHPELSGGQAGGIAGAIMLAFQITPISPGSLVRGLYVVYLVVRERNFKDYNIAVFLGFFKYVGYLAFPIQMTYRYPALARFMAAHWATGAIHFVPVFGEHGALMEHGVFDLFYNRPLTVRRRMRKRAEMRAALRSRSWHVEVIAVLGVAVFVLTDLLWLRTWSRTPTLLNVWFLVLGLPLLSGAAVTLFAGGTALTARIKLAALCGLVIGVASAVGHVLPGAFTLSGSLNPLLSLQFLKEFGGELLWRAFLFTVLAGLGAILTEILLPDPDLGGPPAT